MQSLTITVKGRVQGVCFRAYTQKTARQLDITGQVKNQIDGSVEIQATANEKDLQKFVQWCHSGPLLAKVTEVTVTQLTTVTKYINFEIID